MTVFNDIQIYVTKENIILTHLHMKDTYIHLFCNSNKINHNLSLEPIKQTHTSDVPFNDIHLRN